VSARRHTIRRDVEGAQIVSRLLGCLPAATVEMETLCRMAGIKVNRAIPTAAVECVYRPRLLLNPDFITKYCERDEHLFLLVMHELWHVVLAHTRLYPRATPAHNIAFDAIINAGLSRQYNRPEYQGFFDALNPADKFPHVLLRPPVGWPTNPQYPDDIGPAGTRGILERLYPPAGAKHVAMPFYDEILKLLRQYAEENGWVWIDGEPFLLGDHDNPDAEAAVYGKPILGDVMRRVQGGVASHVPLGSRGTGGSQEDWLSDVDHASEYARRAFSNVLRRCLGPRRGGQRRRAKTPTPSQLGTSVLPNPRDRMAPARRMLGMPNTLWNQQGTVKARLPEVPSKAHVYLDVSGSMAELLPHLLGLVMPYVFNGLADIFQFSTIVEPLPMWRLQRGRLQSTGGTDINCVLQHVLEVQPTVQRALLLTDGATGTPEDELLQKVREQNLHIYVVLPAEAAWEDDLREMADLMVVLPPLWGSRPH
jgi:hypothetical protein